MDAVHFTPRRLGHVNVWVEDLEHSIRFYETVCGIELVRRERAIKIAFHTNGNTHHDIGLIEISRGVDRVGRDGTVQIPATRGLTVGLNHLGWEMESEATLVAAFRRLRAAVPGPIRTVDHLISHSVYVDDPDGNGHEFYADALKNWRSIYNLDQEDEVTGLWDPEAREPDPTPYYNVDPPLRTVAAAPLHPGLLIGATFATSNFDAMADFFRAMGGLKGATTGARGQRTAVLAGALGRADMTLTEVEAGAPTGLTAFTFKLLQAAAIEPLKSACAALGVAAPVVLDHAGKQRIDLVDPNGFRLSFVH